MKKVVRGAGWIYYAVVCVDVWIAENTKKIARMWKMVI